MTYEFNERLAFSRGIREATDKTTLEAMIPGCVKCWKSELKDDRNGIDYFVRLRKGALLRIDAKARDKIEPKVFSFKKSSWRYGEPELALEEWNVKPCEQCPSGKTGWTLTEAKNVDLILFTFDPRDTSECFLMSFPLLRIAFRKHIRLWKTLYMHAPQPNYDKNTGCQWTSYCVFVPVGEVFRAVERISSSEITLGRIVEDDIEDLPCQESM